MILDAGDNSSIVNCNREQAMSAKVSSKQASMLRTIKRHGGKRVMSAVDMRLAKPLMRNGFLIATEDGYFNLSESALQLLKQPLVKGVANIVR